MTYVLIAVVAVAWLAGVFLAVALCRSSRRGEELDAAVRRHPAGNTYVRTVIEGRARQRPN